MSSTVASAFARDDLQLLSNNPLLPPPEGVTSNFTDPTSRKEPQIVVTSLLLGIATVFFLNRIYMKTCIIRKYTWDDLTISIAMVGTVVFYAAAVIETRGDLVGVHLWDISISQVASKIVLISSYLVLVSTSPTFLFTKITFLVMYRHIFGPLRWMRITALFGAVFTTLFYGSMTVLVFIFVTPRKGESWFSHASTLSKELEVGLFIPSSVVGLIIDIYILVLPIAAVSKLQMATRRKFGIIVIFATGSLACLGSILSIYYRVLLLRTKDYTWALIPCNIMTLLEMLLGIICACMPAAAYACHYHLPLYTSLKKIFHTHYGSIEKKLRGPPATSSSLPGSDSHNMKTSHGVYEGYVKMPVKSLQTFIHSGSPDDLNNDSIHLTYEMQQSSASSETHNRARTDL